MATMVVLMDEAPGAGAVDPAAADGLAGLGVTSVTVVHDDFGIGVVLDGWAFDPAAAGDRAAALVAGRAGRVRTLHPLLQTAVSAGPGDGAARVSTARARGVASRGGSRRPTNEEES